MAEMQAISVTCPAIDATGVDVPKEFCANARPGDTLPGYLVSNGSVSLPYSKNTIMERLTFGKALGHSDNYGPASFELFSVGCPIGNADCSTRFSLVVSGVGDRLPNSRAVNVMFVSQVDAELKVVSVLSTQLPPIPGSDAVLSGGTPPSSYPGNVHQYEFTSLRSGRHPQ